MVSLLSQDLAADDLKLDSPTACTTTTSDDGSTVENSLYGVSGFLKEFIKFLPGWGEVDEVVSVGYDVWVRKNILKRDVN